MAHYRAVIHGSRGEASRLGTKKSGIKAIVNAWDIGVTVEARYENGANIFRVYKTGGSNNGAVRICMAEITDAKVTEGV
jgi:hypothetical protein